MISLVGFNEGATNQREAAVIRSSVGPCTLGPREMGLGIGKRWINLMAIADNKRQPLIG